jgi:RecG-like helicase
MRHKEIAFLGTVLLLFSFFSFGQNKEHFYNVDQEVRIEGKIQNIAMEPRYEDKSPFLIVTLEEKDTKNLYNVEISPAGFFDQDFHKGEHLTVTGSLTTSGESEKNIIAREVQSKGETFILRDKHGFPQWRGGKGLMSRKGKRKGKRF